MGKISRILLLLGAAALALPAMVPQPAVAAPANAISAYFVAPLGTQAENEAMYKTMKADAIVTGGRVKPVDATVPSAVASSMSGKKLYYDTPVALASSKLAKTIKVGTATWGIVNVPSGTVAIRVGAARVDGLVKAGNAVKAGTWVGLPRPALRTDITWLPDVSYLPQLAEFTKVYTAHYKAMGAEGLYQGFEMPVTDTPYWQPVRDLYAAQNKAVNGVWAKAPVVISPYLETRKAKAYFTPAQAASGATKIMATANGVRVIVAPQDGLGTGAACLQGANCSAFHAPVESYWTAMTKAVPTMWNNTETMRPDPKDPTKRIKATKSEVSAALWRAANRGGGFDGTISWSWNYAPGASDIPGITVFSAGFLMTGR